MREGEQIEPFEFVVKGVMRNFLGPRRDLVGELTESVRKSGLRMGLYYSLKDWHHADGMRIDPPPSVPSAIGSRPSATAAADPPEEPPVLRVVSKGFLVAPKR